MAVTPITSHLYFRNADIATRVFKVDDTAPKDPAAFGTGSAFKGVVLTDRGERVCTRLSDRSRVYRGRRNIPGRGQKTISKIAFVPLSLLSIA